MTALTLCRLRFSDIRVLRFLFIRVPLGLSVLCLMIILNTDRVDSFRAEMLRPAAVSDIPVEITPSNAGAEEIDEDAYGVLFEIPRHQLRKQAFADWIAAEEERAVLRHERMDPAVFAQHEALQPSIVESTHVEIPNAWLFKKLETQSEAPFFRRPISPTSAGE